MSVRLRSLRLLAAVGALAGAAVACDTLECGDGTHREGDECVPNVQVQCGEGTRFEFGECVSDGTAAGGGDTGGGAGGGAAGGDTGGGAGGGPAGGGTGGGTGGGAGGGDTGGSMGGGAGGGAGGGTGGGEGGGTGGGHTGGGEGGGTGGGHTGGMGGMDAMGGMGGEGGMEPPPDPCEGIEAGDPPGCAAPPGGYCVHGVAVDFLTGCALPESADSGLGLLLLDPLAVAGGATVEEAARGTGMIGPGGVFSIQAISAANSLSITIDEADGVPADTYARSVTPILATATEGDTEYLAPGGRIFATEAPTVEAWSQALGLGADGLLQTGFIIGVVIDAQGRPVDEAVVEGDGFDYTTCPGDNHCLRFFNDDASGFQDAGADRTGRRGLFMVIRGGQAAINDTFRVTEPAGFAPLRLGAAPGSGFHVIFAPAQ